MRLRIPIYGQILGWFFLNLAVLSAIFYLFARVELRLGLDSLLLGAAGDRIQAVGNLIAQELSEVQKQGELSPIRRSELAQDCFPLRSATCGVFGSSPSFLRNAEI